MQSSESSSEVGGIGGGVSTADEADMSSSQSSFSSPSKRNYDKSFISSSEDEAPVVKDKERSGKSLYNTEGNSVDMDYEGELKSNWDDGRKWNSMDKCDCLIKNCPGCHMPCKNCKRRTCGHICKLRRNWETYEEVEVQGTAIVRKPGSNDIDCIDIS